jgi:hypothetical protein
MVAGIGWWLLAGWHENVVVSRTLDDFVQAPLPEGPVADEWCGYLECWWSGRRSEALARAAGFVDGLNAAGSDAVDEFARWLCQELFDRSDMWAGQWGGGLRFRDGRWQRPVEFALTSHSLIVGVVLPYLLVVSDRGHGPGRRWLYQFLVGQSYRLPPQEHQRLRLILDDRYGAGAQPVDVLRLAADHDPVARRMLQHLDDQ